MRPHDCAGTAFLLAYTLQAERHESESMAHARGRLTGGLRWLAAVGGCHSTPVHARTRVRRTQTKPAALSGAEQSVQRHQFAQARPCEATGDVVCCIVRTMTPIVQASPCEAGATAAQRAS
jgi:hypothetical protein